MLAGARFYRERMSEAASDELLAATDIADLLVARCDIPFREAHGVVAGLVRTAVDSGRVLSRADGGRARGAQRRAGGPQRALLRGAQQSSWLESKISEGGTSTARVKEQIELARTTLDADASA